MYQDRHASFACSHATSAPRQTDLPLRVGLLGLGAVGAGTYRVVQRNADVIAARTGGRIEIAMIAVHKLTLLVSNAFGGPIQFGKVHTEGITQLDAAGVTMYYGAGAGSEQTASAVIADLVDLARSSSVAHRHRVPSLAFQHWAVVELPVAAIEDVQTAYYLRVDVAERSGTSPLVLGHCLARTTTGRPGPGEDHSHGAPDVKRVVQTGCWWQWMMAKRAASPNEI